MSSHSSLIAIGKKMPQWLQLAYTEYTKRLHPILPLQLIELPPCQKKLTREQIQLVESNALSAATPKNAYKIVLDERGLLFSTQMLAQHWQQWQSTHSQLAFLIGGAEGHHSSLRAEADVVWSLSPLTLPHAMVRLVLIEQIYRVQMVLQGHPYHRED